MRILFLIASFLLLTACGEANNQAQTVVPESAQKVSLAQATTDAGYPSEVLL